MLSISGLAETAALVGDPTRAAMLMSLMDGRALTAGELARAGGVTAQTASGHLAKMLEAGLLALEAQGRHRYYRLASPAIAGMIEAMMVGLPIVGLATTELPSVIRNGESGFVDTRLERLVDAMQMLLRDPAEARRLGEAARRTAEERFNIDRFVDDWRKAFARVTA